MVRKQTGTFQIKLTSTKGVVFVKHTVHTVYVSLHLAQSSRLLFSVLRVTLFNHICINLKDLG